MAAVPPPPPLPPPPPPLPPPPAGRVLRDALERAGAALGGDGGVRELLRRRRDSLTPALKWLLFHRPAPPLIQDGPQCGLVALSMAASLLFPSHGVRLGQLVRAAQDRGFTHRGEMFSAADMAALARDVFPCHPELLSGGLEGPNLPRVLQHLISGLPLLVPYDEDSNHEPCQRRGHKAHWAVLTGVLLGVRTATLGPAYRPDPEIPNLFHPPPSGGGELSAGGGAGLRWGGPGGAVERVLVLAQQGKSPRAQLWPLGGLHGSNAQLRELGPHRRRDGHRYVLPAGGLAHGLGGRAVLLRPRDSAPGTAPPGQHPWDPCPGPPRDSPPGTAPPGPPPGTAPPRPPPRDSAPGTPAPGQPPRDSPPGTAPPGPPRDSPPGTAPPGPPPMRPASLPFECAAAGGNWGAELGSCGDACSLPPGGRGGLHPRTLPQ